MKKSLLALAVLGAFAGAASAQQTNVTIYGIVDAAISHTDTSAATNDKTWSLDSSRNSNQSGSRLGFKGSEDLGGGLSAIFTLENGFSADDGNMAQGGRLFGRQAFVGLQGGFGAVKLGRQQSPMHNVLTNIDPFGTGFAGNIENVFNAFSIRTDNTVNYSLNAGAFSGELAYTFGEVAGSTSTGRQWGLSGTYANGPVMASLAYHNQNLVAAGIDNGDLKSTLLGGTYNFGPATAHVAFGWDKGDNVAGVDNVKNRNWMLGVSAPVSAAGTVLASYIRKDDRLAANNDVKQWALGYTHSLSKRTNLYTSYGRLDNENAVDVSTFNVGVRHKF